MARRPPRGGGSRGYYVGGRGRGHVNGREGNERVRDDSGRDETPPPEVAVVLQSFPDENAMLSRGLSFVGFPESRQRVSKMMNTRRFRAHFGVGAKALSALYRDLTVVMPRIEINEFFIALNWLKLYDTEHVLAARWLLNEKKIRSTCRTYVKKIQELKESKVKWSTFEEDEIFIISVDGVHCRIQEVRKDPGSKWYSHKHNAAGVTYELGIAIRSNQLVWINGPFPASKHDITTFRSDDDPEKGLKSKIPDGKKAIGDSGYKGEPTKVSVTRDRHSAEVKEYFGRVKSRHETFNARLKSFRVLDTAFRHGFDQHKQVFEAVCIVVQYDIENGHGLFEV